MVGTHELSQFDIFKQFTDQEISQMASIGQLHIFSEGKKIFVQNSFLKNLYLMVSGEISLTFDINPDITFIITNLRPGIFFGTSSLVGSKTPHNAYCSQPSEVIVFPIQGLMEIFDKDKRLGYKFYYEMLKFCHKVTQSRTWDILKTIYKKI